MKEAAGELGVLCDAGLWFYVHAQVKEAVESYLK